MRINDIMWETDGNKVEVPNEVEIPDNVDKEDISNWLSDKCSWLVMSCDIADRTYSQDANDKILEFFSLVANGIREEYENGASYRKLEVDIETIKEMLEMKDRKIRERIDIIRKIVNMKRTSTVSVIPMIKNEIELLKELI